MHELAVTESILKIAIDHANRANASKVTGIYLVLGKFSSIIDDSVAFYWDILAKDTICSDAELHFERIPATLACLDCEANYTLEQELIPCPQCGSSRVRVITGDEFRLDSIEITK
jgi:hydrogenase nickel incorporation protein HypA/HybF